MKWVPKNAEEKKLRDRTDNYLLEVKKLEELEKQLAEQKKKAEEKADELKQIKYEKYKIYRETKNNLRSNLEGRLYRENVEKQEKEAEKIINNKLKKEYKGNKKIGMTHGLPSLLNNLRNQIDTVL